MADALNTQKREGRGWADGRPGAHRTCWETTDRPVSGLPNWNLAVPATSPSRTCVQWPVMRLRSITVAGAVWASPSLAAHPLPV